MLAAPNGLFAANMSGENTPLASVPSIRNPRNSNPFPGLVGQPARLSCCHTPETPARPDDTLTQIPLATRSGFLTPSPHQTESHRSCAAPAAVDTISHIPNCSPRARYCSGSPARVPAQRTTPAKPRPTAASPDAATQDRPPVRSAQRMDKPKLVSLKCRFAMIVRIGTNPTK